MSTPGLAPRVAYTITFTTASTTITTTALLDAGADSHHIIEVGAELVREELGIDSDLLSLADATAIHTERTPQ